MTNLPVFFFLDMHYGANVLSHVSSDEIKLEKAWITYNQLQKRGFIITVKAE